MSARALVSNQLYFGLDPLALIAGAERTLARLAGLPLGKAFVDVETLREDFRISDAAARGLLQAFAASSLVELDPEGSGEYRATARLREFAQARVVPPLSRAEAKDVLDRACAFAEKHNADAVRNPLFIDRIAVSGSYLNVASDRIGKIVLWAVVRPRVRLARPPLTERQGAHGIRAALRELAPHVLAETVTDTNSVQRPFGVPFEAGNETMPGPTTAAPLGEWVATFRRRLGDR